MQPQLFSALMSAPAGRLLARTRGGLAVLACALAAHAVLYRSLWPSDGVHGYFGWYEPLVWGLSALAVLLVGALLIAGLLGLRSRAVETLKSLLRPAAQPDVPPSSSIGRLATASLVLLLVQESLERSFASGSPAVATFAPSEWLLLFVVLGLFAAALVFGTRSCAALLDLVFADSSRRAIPPLRSPRPARLFLGTLRRQSPLALGRGLRAPPILAG